MVLLVLAPADHVWTNVCARTRDAGRRSELRIPGIAAQTRMVSLARIRLVSRKSPRIFKRIVCDDVSEFESHMPSQPVQSLCAMSRSQEFLRHSRGLCLRGFALQDIELMPKHKDFGFQRSPRPEQADQGAPDQSGKDCSSIKLSTDW